MKLAVQKASSLFRKNEFFRGYLRQLGAICGNINKAPIKKQQAPINVKTVAKSGSSDEIGEGVANDKTAEIKKATHPK